MLKDDGSLSVSTDSGPSGPRGNCGCLDTYEF